MEHEILKTRIKCKSIKLVEINVIEATRLMRIFNNKSLDKDNVDSVWVDLANRFKRIPHERLSIQSNGLIWACNTFL